LHSHYLHSDGVYGDRIPGKESLWILLYFGFSLPAIEQEYRGVEGEKRDGRERGWMKED